MVAFLPNVLIHVSSFCMIIFIELCGFYTKFLYPILINDFE
jgi:hypothetical protein